MFKNQSFVFLFLVSMVFPAYANEEKITHTNGNGIVQSQLDCKGKVAVVNGSENVLTYTGFCGGLRVKGNGNTIIVQLLPNSLLKVEGVDNTIRWTGKNAPKVSVKGADNTIGSDE
jgi:hypothetical protein